VRIFDNRSAKNKKVTVLNDALLYDRPDLVLIKEWLDKKSKKGEFKARGVAQGRLKNRWRSSYQNQHGRFDMSWKFWEKSSAGAKTQKLPGPKRLPHPVGRTIVVEKGENPDWVWGLHIVERPTEGKKHCFDVRVFDPDATAKKGIPVRDYTSLNQVPELILYEGWYDKKSNQAVLDKGATPKR